MLLQGNFSPSFACTPFTALVTLVGNMASVENKVQRAQASAFSGALLTWGCLYEAASFRYETHEESFPTCSLLLTALSLSKPNIQGEALISDLSMGLLVLHLQCVLLSQPTKVQGVVLLGTRRVFIWLKQLTNSLCCCTPAQCWDTSRVILSL